MLFVRKFLIPQIQSAYLLSGPSLLPSLQEREVSDVSFAVIISILIMIDRYIELYIYFSIQKMCLAFEQSLFD